MIMREKRKLGWRKLMHQSSIPPTWYVVDLYLFRLHLRPILQRGIHDIRNELVFASNPGFGFHDSPGLESGSNAEVSALEEFIREGAQSLKLEKRIHLIASVIYGARLINVSHILQKYMSSC
jgi:hypothetical protein